MAPGVTTMAMTRKAPTVSSRRRWRAESSTKKTAFSEVGAQADRAGVVLVEEGDHQVLPLGEQHGQRDEADDGQLQRVLRA